jgi:hypothetical protein
MSRAIIDVTFHVGGLSQATVALIALVRREGETLSLAASAPTNGSD